MAMNFMKNCFENNVNERDHKKFIRFGKGSYDRELFTIKMGSKIQIQGGFEYLDVLMEILSKVATEDFLIKGIIVSKEKILPELKNFDIEPKKVYGKKYTVEATIPADRFNEFLETFSNATLLLKITSGINQLSAKTTVPKPGKLVEKFVTLKVDKSAEDLIRSEFLFDYSEKFKMVSIKHTYVINDIIVDEELIKSDPAKARLEAKRSGSIVRELTADGEVIKTEDKDFTA